MKNVISVDGIGGIYLLDVPIRDNEFREVVMNNLPDFIEVVGEYNCKQEIKALKDLLKDRYLPISVEMGRPYNGRTYLRCKYDHEEDCGYEFRRVDVITLLDQWGKPHKFKITWQSPDCRDCQGENVPVWARGQWIHE